MVKKPVPFCYRQPNMPSFHGEMDSTPPTKKSNGFLISLPSALRTLKQLTNPITKLNI